MLSFEQKQKPGQLRPRRRSTAATTSVAVAVAIQLLALLQVLVFCQAFQPQQSHGRIDSSISRRRRVSQLSTSSLQFYSDPEAPTAVTAPSFQQRMREQLRRRQSHEQQKKKQKQKINTSSNSKSSSKSWCRVPRCAHTSKNVPLSSSLWPSFFLLPSSLPLVAQHSTHSPFLNVYNFWPKRRMASFLAAFFS